MFGGKGRALIFSQFWFSFCYSNVFDEFVSPTTSHEADSVITAMRRRFKTKMRKQWGIIR